jgi:hypothetical protein
MASTSHRAFYRSGLFQQTQPNRARLAAIRCPVRGIRVPQHRPPASVVPGLGSSSAASRGSALRLAAVDRCKGSRPIPDAHAYRSLAPPDTVLTGRQVFEREEAIPIASAGPALLGSARSNRQNPQAAQVGRIESENCGCHTIVVATGRNPSRTLAPRSRISTFRVGARGGAWLPPRRRRWSRDDDPECNPSARSEYSSQRSI